MKLWLATTDPLLVTRHFALGLFEGVLTNPTMIADTHRSPLEVIGALCAASPTPVFYQLNNTTADDMKRAAGRLRDLGWANLGIKVPLTREGCEVLHWLRQEGVKLRLATCVPTTAQVILATALEVPWVTPAGSVLEKLGGPAKLALLTEMQTLLDRQQSPTCLIPSLATPAEMQVLALAGIRAGFVWDRDVSRFVDSELVRQSLAGFDTAWAKLRSDGATYY